MVPTTNNYDRNEDMREERRATVTTAKIDSNKPKMDLSITLSNVQVIGALIVHAITIISAALALSWWLGRVMVHQEFDKSIKEFHQVARPQIEEIIDSKILKHEEKVEGVFANERDDILQRLATNEEGARQRDERLARIENKLDRLLERGRSGS